MPTRLAECRLSFIVHQIARSMSLDTEACKFPTNSAAEVTVDHRCSHSQDRLTGSLLRKLDSNQPIIVQIQTDKE